MEIKDLSVGLRRRFQIIVNQEELNQEIDAILTKLQKTTPVGGFARGEAPLEKVKLLFEKQAKATASENLINKHLSDFVSASGFWADAKPMIEPEFKASSSKRYTGLFNDQNQLEVIVSWESESPPEIKDYLGVTVEIPSGSREDAITNQLRILQARAATNKPVDRAAIGSDTLMVDIEVRPFDAPELELKGGKFDGFVFSPQFSDTKYFGQPLNDLSVGLSVGDVFNYAFNFPDNHPDAYLRGQNTTVYVKILEVNEAVIPEINDEFAVIAGYEDLEKMKTHIGEVWDNNEKSKQKALIQNQYREKLLAANAENISVDEKQTTRIFESLLGELNLTPELINHEKLAKVKENLMKSATETAKLTKLFKFIYDLHPSDCKLTNEDLLRYAGEQAQRGVTAEQQLLSLKGSTHFKHWINKVQLRKVEDWLLSGVVLVQV